MLDSLIKVANKWLIGSSIDVHRCSRLDNLIIHNENPVTHGKSFPDREWQHKGNPQSLLQFTQFVLHVCSAISTSADKGSSNKTTRGWLMMARVILHADVVLQRVYEWNASRNLPTDHLENFATRLDFFLVDLRKRRVGKAIFSNIFICGNIHRIGRPYGLSRLLVGMLIRTIQ